MPSPSDEPLIYTALGNLPVSSLRYETAWHDDADCTVFRETYYLGEEVVKQSIHVMRKQGLLTDLQQGVFA